MDSLSTLRRSLCAFGKHSYARWFVLSHFNPRTVRALLPSLLHFIHRPVRNVNCSFPVTFLITLLCWTRFLVAFVTIRLMTGPSSAGWPTPMDRQDHALLPFPNARVDTRREVGYLEALTRTQAIHRERFHNIIIFFLQFLISHRSLYRAVDWLDLNS